MDFRSQHSRDQDCTRDTKKGVTRRMTPFRGKTFPLFKTSLLGRLTASASLYDGCSGSRCGFACTNDLVMSGVHTLDVSKFLTGAAEPDVDILGLCAEFDCDVFDAGSCFAGVGEEGEDFLFQSSALATFAGFAGRATGLAFRSSDLRCCGLRSSGFWCCCGGLAGREGYDFLIDRSNFVKQGFFLFRKSKESA